MSKKIEVNGSGLFVVVCALVILFGGSFFGGYALALSDGDVPPEQVGHAVPGQGVGDFSWIFAPEQVRVLPPKELVPPSRSPMPVGEAVAVQQAPETQPRAAPLSLEMCLKLPCEIGGEDWETLGFKPATVNKLTEKYLDTTRMRAQCEQVLQEAASRKRSARKQLECVRTRHREAQCAVLHWNTGEALARDANSKLIIRSAIVLRLLADFFVHGVKHPNHISLCIGDIEQQYEDWVKREAQAYMLALKDTPVRMTEFDTTFCAEQQGDIVGIVGENFLPGESLQGFEFPPGPVDATVQALTARLCSAPTQVVSSTN